jgi:hypothetical protein
MFLDHREAPNISPAPQGSTRILLKSKKFVNRIAQIDRTIEEAKDGLSRELATARGQRMSNRGPHSLAHQSQLTGVQSARTCVLREKL